MSCPIPKAGSLYDQEDSLSSCTVYKGLSPLILTALPNELSMDLCSLYYAGLL